MLAEFQVCQHGLEILSLIADQMKEDFRPYIQTVLPAVTDRLGITNLYHKCNHCGSQDGPWFSAGKIVRNL